MGYHPHSSVCLIWQSGRLTPCGCVKFIVAASLQRSRTILDCTARRCRKHASSTFSFILPSLLPLSFVAFSSCSSQFVGYYSLSLCFAWSFANRNCVKRWPNSSLEDRWQSWSICMRSLPFAPDLICRISRYLVLVSEKDMSVPLAPLPFLTALPLIRPSWPVFHLISL